MKKDERKKNKTKRKQIHRERECERKRGVYRKEKGEIIKLGCFFNILWVV